MVTGLKFKLLYFVAILIVHVRNRLVCKPADGLCWAFLFGNLLLFQNSVSTLLCILQLMLECRRLEGLIFVFQIGQQGQIGQAF